MMWAYIGPDQILPVAGAGGGIIALLAAFWGIVLVACRRVLRRRKTWIGLALLAILLALIMGILHQFARRTRPIDQKVIILGIDGLDPQLLARWMDEGKLPNFARLRRDGTFAPLATTTPPQSPVAWTTFATGCNPGRHGIFDFLRRLPQSYLPDLALAGFDTAGRVPRAVHYRQAPAFWELLAADRFQTSVIRCPCTFPPDEVRGEMLSGLGVPDLLGSQGSSAFYTAATGSSTNRLAGRLIELEPGTGPWETNLHGPRDPSRPGQPHSALPVSIAPVAGGPAIQLTIGKQSERIEPRAWSPWFQLPFTLTGGTTRHGIARAFLVSSPPELKLYISAIQFDPHRPAFPISYPRTYSGDLADAIGLYHTLGQPEDTMALNEDRLDEAAFLEQCDQVMRERLQMMRLMLRQERHVRAIVFDTSDRIQHMFWRFLEPEHPAYDPELAVACGDAVERMYRESDAILGEVLAAVDAKTTLFVVSDHGFAPFRRAVHLNRWLYDEGFLHLLPGKLPDDASQYFADVDWSRTRAFALGFNSLYINQRGREPQGIVEPGRETEQLKGELQQKLAGLVDPQTGEPMIHSVSTRQEAWWGEATETAPDLVVGYERGYRASWKTALGGIPSLLVEENTSRWSGDHCMDPALVPGVFLSSRPIRKADPGLADIAPTIFQLLGAPIPENMDGHPLF